MDPAILELYVKENDEIKLYLAPDFIQMRDFEIRAFFARLSEVINDPVHTIRKSRS